jgi:hypothetical protein
MYGLISSIYFIVGLFNLFLLFMFIGMAQIATDDYLSSFISMFISVYFLLSSIDTWHGNTEKGLLRKIIFFYGPGLLILGSILYLALLIILHSSY